MPKLAAHSSANRNPGLKLYEIAEGLAAIDAVLDETGGEISVEIEDQLDALELALPQKIDGICGMVREFESHEAACREESKFFGDKARVYGNKSKSLKAYMQKMLEKIGRDKVDGERFKVALQNNPIAIRYTGDIDHIPADYLILNPAFDNAKAKDDYKAGVELPDCIEVRQDRHLRIQ